MLIRLHPEPLMIVEVSHSGDDLILEPKVPYGILFVVLIKYCDLPFPAGHPHEVHGLIQVLHAQHLRHLIISGAIHLREHTWLEKLKGSQDGTTLRMKDMALTFGITEVQKDTLLRGAVPPGEAREGQVLLHKGELPLLQGYVP